MTGSVGAYVAQVDHVLGAGVGLFPASVGGRGGPGGGGGPAVPAAPGGGGLSTAVTGARDGYRRGWDGVQALDTATGAAAGDGAAQAGSGRAVLAGVQASARSTAAALAPAAGSAAGVNALVSSMDERLAAMQRQIATTRAQNRLLAVRLRQLAAAYQRAALSAATAGLRPPPLAGLGQLPALGGGLGALAGLPRAVLVGRPAGAETTPGAVGRSIGGALPVGVASEKGLQKDTVLAARAVSAAFPQIRSIGGMRPDALPWHPNGQAIDVMIPDPSSPQGKALGDEVVKFALAHRGTFSLNHVIWRQTMYNPDGSSYGMEDRGSPTQNHMDHVHIATNGGGYPRGGEVYQL